MKMGSIDAGWIQVFSRSVPTPFVESTSFHTTSMNYNMRVRFLEYTEIQLGRPWSTVS